MRETAVPSTFHKGGGGGHNSVFVQTTEEDRQSFGLEFFYEWWL